jgi:Flp pilus assembly protein TadG
MRRAKNRKGIFVVLFGILFMSLMGAAAISIDFARIWAMRNELQTTADAAALAGAVQIGLTPTDSLQISNAARNYAAETSRWVWRARSTAWYSDIGRTSRPRALTTFSA